MFSRAQAPGGEGASPARTFSYIDPYAARSGETDPEADLLEQQVVSPPGLLQSKGRVRMRQGFTPPESRSTKYKEGRAPSPVSAPS